MFGRLVTLMATLRGHGGCDWDRAQDFASIVPYTIEEAYEVADAVARDDMAALCDELGDLQLQVVFHAAIAADRGAFTIDDVLAAIVAKMERRHPHIFFDAPRSDWESIKAAERSTADLPGALAGVAQALPALLRATKLQKRAARVGFDWPDPRGAREKISEELAEVEAATDPDHQAEEVGDLLFAVVNWARHLGIDPEAALRNANGKFERRFAAMEALDPDFVGRSLAEKEALWTAVKQRE
ncbi:nucleoside triphosphate pyrophosphohydrolase [Sphingomonas montana]|uniref:nucleoside triphosphate pyrophosphohydrolase n=1 Tax=Sphingomonas montana TaxID=1843236 RepID=UPI00096F020D|nr:nucleoside triphosphate pyrophosphohydrolase [Sphingomonas montana]